MVQYIYKGIFTLNTVLPLSTAEHNWLWDNNLNLHESVMLNCIFAGSS